MNANRCPECKAYLGHHALCPKIGCDEAKKQLKTYYNVWLKQTKELEDIINRNSTKINAKIKRLESEIILWKGKYYTVKAENNQLRKNQLKSK